jgi:hypothetical protein
MLIFLFLITLEPIKVIHLGKEFNSIKVYNDRIYCAPFTGKSIFMLDDSNHLIPTTFTDNVNYRIYDFHMTPFALYLNNGSSIEKYYPASGVKENIYSSKDISSFVLTTSDEVILSDRYTRELIFLDFTNSARLKKTDLQINDMQMVNGIIYILTKNKILNIDEHGNILKEEKIPGKLNRIFVNNNTVIIFSSNSDSLYMLDTDAKEINLSHGIRDISGNDGLIVILDKNGTTLYLYSTSEFE